jgi:hypothetical protein
VVQSKTLAFSAETVYHSPCEKAIQPKSPRTANKKPLFCAVGKGFSAIMAELRVDSY